MGKLLRLSRRLRIRRRLAYANPAEGTGKHSVHVDPAFTWGDYVFRLVLAHTGDRELAARKANAIYRKIVARGERS